MFDQGQVFALDLDGQLLWGHREKAGHDNRGSFHRSPLVCGDIVLVRTYFKEFDPDAFAGCYLGTPSYATEHMSGPVPHGNRLLVQTSAFLYCIGKK